VPSSEVLRQVTVCVEWVDEFVDAGIIWLQMERFTNAKEASPWPVFVFRYKNGHGSHM